MKNKKFSLDDDEQSLIEVIENISSALVQNITLLDGYSQLNKDIQDEIISVMDSLNISYKMDMNNHLTILDKMTYKNDMNGIINLNKINKMEKRYNDATKCINEIEDNKKNIESTMLFKIKSEMVNRISNELDQVGYRILEAQEKERSRIACDLHDSVIQNLTSLVHKLELCIKTADKDIIQVKLDLEIMMQYIRSTINDIRHIVYNLRPLALEDLGFETSVKQYITNFKECNNVNIHLNESTDLNSLQNPIINLTIFRILQEACSNACKHGNAKNISIDFSVEHGSVNLNICDDGSGFDVDEIMSREKKSTHDGFGLSIMKERVYLLSGYIDIKSEIGNGSSIQVKVPMDKS